MSEREELARALEQLADMQFGGGPEGTSRELRRAAEFLRGDDGVRGDGWDDHGNGLLSKRVAGATLYRHTLGGCWTVPDAPKEQAPAKAPVRPEPAPLDLSNLPHGAKVWEGFTAERWPTFPCVPTVVDQRGDYLSEPVTVVVIPRTVCP